MSVAQVLETFAITECHVVPHAHAEDHILIWVYNGRAEVVIDSQHRHVLNTGQAMWIPGGTHHGVDVDADSVALPIFLPVSSGQHVPLEPVTLAIPDVLQDRLLHHFAIGISPLLRSTNGAFADVVNFVNTTGATALPLPSSPAARAIGTELLELPTTDLTVEQWSRRTQLSASTLRRQFLVETGITFQLWRTRCRLRKATALLPTDQALDWIAHHVGFATVSGFSRAFRAEFAMSPRVYGNRVRQGLAVPTIKVIDHCLPAVTSPPSVIDFSVVYWMYQGTARMNVGSRTWSLTKGDAIWVPASERYNAEIDAGSIMLPLASRWNDGESGLKEVAVVHLPDSYDRLLLHIATAINTQVRPHGYDIYRMMFALEEHITGGLGSTPATVAARTIIAAVTDDPKTHLSLSQWSGILGVEAGTIGAALRAETGMSPRKWLTTVRMNAARHYLQTDLSIANIAERVGYTHHSAFTRAFKRTHGLTPRQLQQGRVSASS